MTRHLKYLFPILCFFMARQLGAQNSQLRSYTIEDGLPQSQVYDLLQDDMGYLWLGTQGGGLANFDGDTFEVWNESDGLLSNYIHALHASHDSLFVGTRRGLSIKTKSRFANFKSPQIIQFCPSKNGIYVATKKGVYIFSHHGQLNKIALHPEIDVSEVNAILFDGNYYWLGTNNGLWRLSALSTTATEIRRMATENFTAVIEHQGQILAATFDDGVHIIDSKNPEDRFLMPEPPRVNAMSIHQGDLWIATDDNGIVIVETEKYAEVKRLNAANGLATPHIRKIVSDNRDNLWIATSGGGLYKYFQNNFKHYDKRTGLKGNRVYAVHSTQEGIWLSHSEKGLTRIDSSGIHPLQNEDPFFDVKIKTITSDAKDNLWVGSDNRGILFRETKMVDSLVYSASSTFQISVDTISKKVTKNYLIDESKGFPSDWIRKLVVDDAVVWAATYASGIVQFSYDSDRDSLTVRKVFGKRDGISDLLIKDFVKDSKERFWFATQNGHLGYIKDSKVTRVETQLEGQTGIGTLLFHNDQLFLGTSGKGIWFADLEDPSNFKRLKGAKKGSSNNIYQLVFDDQGYLWAGTERGVDKIELNAANEIIDVYHFGRNDGFLGIETCLNAVDKDTKGNLWFGAIYGLTQHVPSENTKITVPPKVYFTGLEEGYKKIDSLDLKDWTNSDKVLQLTPTQTQLGFSFRTVDLDHPTEIEYRTKLDASDWSPWIKERKQNFAGLAFGAHTFSVQSRNHRWEKSDPIHFQFFIDSPLYQKDWFRWTVLSLAVLLLLGIGWWYIRKIKAKNKAAQAHLETQNYLLTLEQKALRLQMNPHFIFNVLNGIKAMASSKPEKMNTTINSFAVLLRDTLHNSRKETISLADEVRTLEHYIAVEKLMAPEAFDHQIVMATTPGAEEILIPPMLIQPFVENAIRHGILKGERHGILEIGFHTSQTHLKCSITDNGLGIFKSQTEKVKTDHQSMALVVTKERLISIAGTDTLQMVEIEKEDGTVAGTKISFEIPLLTDY